MAVVAGLSVWAGCKTSAEAPIQVAPIATNAFSLHPGPNDPRIAFVAARLLEGYHYLQHPLDREMSVKFFDGYIDALDPRHENFLQSDMDQFASLRTNLDVLTVGGHGTADLSPAFAIYERFAERAVQHNAYVIQLLQRDKFKFNTADRFLLDRRDQPFPKNLLEAEKLWKQRLDYEYLTEKLAREIHETNGVFSVNLSSEDKTNIPAMLEKRYNWNLRLTTNWSSDNVLQAYLDFGLAHAYDPHSDYFGAPKAADFSIDMNLALFGIGAQLTEDYGYCTIRELVPGGPAMKSKKLKPDDRIVAVAQGDKAPVDVVDMELEKVVQMIRGPKGTEVRLTISPSEDRSARRVVTLVRDEIKLEDRQAHAQLIEYPDGQRLGVINLPSFYAPVDLSGNGRTTPRYTSVDVAKLLAKLKQEKVQGVILDLRSNPGGSLEESVRFTGLFIKDGPVVLQRDANGQVGIKSDTDSDVQYGGPLVVMINRFSASASEIAAAALQDYGRAVIVGDTSTHGKGTVQQLEPLQPFVWPANAKATNDPGTLKITRGKFYRVTGASTQLKGVASDIVLPDILNYSKLIGESSLDNALPWDTIDAVPYDKLNMVQPFLADLKRYSEERLATNQEFAYIHQDIEQFKTNQVDRTVTLNEHDAIAERERLTLQAIDRDHERDARPLPAVKVYEISVKDAGEPGLPAPKTYFETNTVTTDVKTNWAPDVAFYNVTNSFSGASTNYFAPITNLVADGTGAVVHTNEVVNTTIAKDVPQDPALEESANILRDYISLLAKRGMLTAYH